MPHCWEEKISKGQTNFLVQSYRFLSKGPVGSVGINLSQEQVLHINVTDETSLCGVSESSRTARSEEDRDTLWDAWGSWSECSRTCGGGASYSLRRCLSSKSCEGQNIKYRTCSNVDCPPEAGDFRAQQCSAHADVRYQGRYHEWLPVSNDPENPCALKCRSRASGLVAELAPKVLDGTRCYTESLDMCISGACQIVGCDHELGSTAKEDNCGVCNGDGSSCRLVRGHYKSQHASGKTDDTVVSIPYQSRHVRLVLKGPDHLYVESRTLQGVKSDLSLDTSGQYHLENTTIDFQKLSDKEVLRITGPLAADFTVKVQFSSGADSVAQFIYYQPIGHRWRETDFFPCSVTCGGGYQLTSAECFDLRTGRVVVDQYCHYYPENVKPKPKLQECNMEPCMASDGYKQIMPYDLYHPLPRWENSPWTACSTSCGGGVQSRSVTCVEEDMQGNITPTEEWKCLYSPKTAILQPCNAFDCPTWHAQDWSPCTVTCGQGLRYRVVLCIDHRGLHAGGCNPTTKPHIKEECLVTVPCFRAIDTLPVEAKEPWQKQAIELEEEMSVTEEPTFIPGPWESCSRSCGAGVQRRTVKCQVLLSFSQTVADLPEDECEGVKPAQTQGCYRTPCSGAEDHEDPTEETSEREELHDWEYEGFTECSQSCGRGIQEAIVICLNKQTRETTEESLCEFSRRPPQLLQDCNTQPCPSRWDTGEWSSCSATCGVGLMTRSVACTRRPSMGSNLTEVLRPEDCPSPKPSPVQACNRFDCPPMWETRDWGKCSQTCGGGVQRRQALCKQRLADGSILDLPETFCPSKRPMTQQTCARQDCPAMWVTTEWSQCSVSCGTGVQRLQAVCRKQGEDGRYRTIHHTNCSQIAHPNSVRPCSFSLCENSIKPGPANQPPKKVNIQWRKGKKLQLLVGGFAYMLPWTPVVLRCPTQRFHKGNIQWLKDGKPLFSLTHLSITSLGFVKIYHLLPSDAGVYTCLDGQTREHLVLKIIGRKQKLSLPEAAVSKLNGPGQTKLHISLLNHYDNIVERILELKGSLQDGKHFDKLHLSEKNRSTLEDESGRSKRSGPVVLIVDSHKLDEIIHSQSGEEQLAHLLNELTKKHSESNESTLYPETATQIPLYQNVNVHTLRPRRPVIIQQPQRPGAAPPAAEKTVHVGQPVLLQKPIASLELKCNTLGNPPPIVKWTRNGKGLNYNGRIFTLSTGSLKILLPSKQDEGLYTCTARNRLGAATLSSWLKVNVGKGKSCAHGHTCNSSHVEPLCTGQACSFRWQVEPWSQCSAACGGGSQHRRVRCVTGPDDRAREVGSHHCSGRSPPNTRLCNMLPCARWATTPWGQCHGQCVGSSLATQHRHVYCQNTSGTKVSFRLCTGLQRPISVKNCSTDACALQWRIGPWTQCTASCGRHGFQSRLVSCVHRRTGKTTREHHCMWRPRPSSWQRCNVLSCGRAGECLDSTRYCDKVRQLELCPLPQFKSRCCHSCRKT
uniref:ADAMTS-like protein 1 n=1 Tax=Knipowitschia caucasica TaxID=637954 RepID=A0AAV2KJD2_KNICA